MLDVALSEEYPHYSLLFSDNGEHSYCNETPIEQPAVRAVDAVLDDDCPSTTEAARGQDNTRVLFLGFYFQSLDVAQAASRIAARPASGRFDYVVTPNADHFVRTSRDPALGAIYRDAAIRLLDSRVVAGFGRLLGLAVPLVAPGSDVTAHLLAHHVQPGERITIIGLAPRWLPVLVETYGLAPPAHTCPAMGFSRDRAATAEVVAFVQANPSRLVFLAVGSPQQEYLAAAIVAAGGATGTGLCVGASLEFLVGAKCRAPEVLQRMGLEWLFRLASNPLRLFRRYVVDSPVVIALLLRQRLAVGRSGRLLRA